jgi:hypothetical protein
MVLRGGLIAIPLGLIYLAIYATNQVVTIAAVLFVIAPGAAFLGGLAYGIVARPLPSPGRPSYVLRLTCASLVYSSILTFIICPGHDSTAFVGNSAAVNRGVAVGMGLFFAISLGMTTYD